MMLRGEGWICWTTKEAPALRSVKPIETTAREKEKPIQEQQFGLNIDSLPIERNAPAPVGSLMQSTKKFHDRPPERHSGLK